MADTIPSRLFEQARVHPNRAAYYVKSGRSWVPTSWRDYQAQVRQASKAMIALGIQPGQPVAILGSNRPEWVIFHIAAMAIGAAPAGIYTTCSPPEVRYVVAHSEAPLVLIEDEEQWEKIDAERDNMPGLKHAILMKSAPRVDDPLALSWNAFMAHGDEITDAEFTERFQALSPDQLATLIYTSGTTGPPKGVMLSHNNLAWTARAAVGVVDLTFEDCMLSYLPLSHIAEQMFTIYGPITAGSAVYFAESGAHVPENLKEVQPTIFMGVPRIWEKFHAHIANGLSEASASRQKLFRWAMEVGAKVSALQRAGEEPGGVLALQHKLADRLIFSRLKPAIGLGRARFCATGAAPTSKEILEFFAGLTITIHEVYGQSEGCGPTTINAPGRVQLGTVGQALPGMQIRINDDGEIIGRGENVFMGYFKDPEATRSALKDGWLHSGDLGAIDEHGFLTITGRKKEIIITSGGKNITPKNIEVAIQAIEIVSQAVVIGDGRHFLTALITLEPEAARRFADVRGITNEDLHNEPALREHIDAAIHKEVNPQYARVEQIKKFTLLPRELTIEDGELTPTLKIKRRVVNEVWADAIDAMYADD